MSHDLSNYYHINLIFSRNSLLTRNSVNITIFNSWLFHHQRINSNFILSFNDSLIKNIIRNEIFRQFIKFLLTKVILALIKFSTMPQMLKSKTSGVYHQVGYIQKEKYTNI